jgi:hypothetical protein
MCQELPVSRNQFWSDLLAIEGFGVFLFDASAVSAKSSSCNKADRERWWYKLTQTSRPFFSLARNGHHLSCPRLGEGAD